MLPKVTLGNTGKELSRYALGGFHQVEITCDVVADVVDAYLSAGGNYIETARNYGGGASEEKIGRVLKGRSEKIHLASKTSAATAEDARRDLETSLKTLGVDRLDFYFFHGVSPGKLQEITAPGGAVEGLTRAKDEGLIDGMGLSSHHPPVYLDAMERIDLSLLLIWCNYLDNLNFPLIPEQIIPRARSLGVGVTAMKPLADGLLHASVTDAFRYCLGAGAEVAVCGTNSVEQVRQAAEAASQTPADADERERILRKAPELGRYVCRRCGACPEALMRVFELEGVFDRQMIDFYPHGAADNALRKVLAGWFNKTDAARERFAEMDVSVDDLVGSAAEIECPYGIDIPRKIAIATAKLSGGKPQRV